MVCIGLNYTDHAREVGRPAPDEPTLFIKANSSINGPYDPIVRPRGAVAQSFPPSSRSVSKASVSATFRSGTPVALTKV